MSEYPYFVTLAIMIAVGIVDLVFWAIGRQRGRDVEFLNPVHRRAPKCADPRLNELDDFLLVVVTPLAILAFAASLALSYVTDVQSWFFVTWITIPLMSAHQLFVKWCQAFAELAPAEG
jgi:hypothetical protein